MFGMGPESAFIIRRNGCSAWIGIRVQFGPDYARGRGCCPDTNEAALEKEGRVSLPPNPRQAGKGRFAEHRVVRKDAPIPVDTEAYWDVGHRK